MVLFTASVKYTSVKLILKGHYFGERLTRIITPHVGVRDSMDPVQIVLTVSRSFSESSIILPLRLMDICRGIKEGDGCGRMVTTTLQRHLAALS